MTIRLDEAAILDLWEAGQARRPLDRGVLILHAGGHADAAELDLAARDRALLALRRATFGGALEVLADCPDCGAAHELSLGAADLEEGLRLPQPTSPGGKGSAVPRDPTSRDLAALAGAADPAAELRRRLAGDLGTEAAAAADAWIEERLAEAELALHLACTDCGARWREVLDVGAFLWSEIEGAAERALTEVAELAAAFGWSEAAILAMGAPRRQAYLARARAR